MALNACTINGFTLHGRRCADKFSTLIPILHPVIPPVTGTNPRVLRDTHTFQRPYEIEDQPNLTFEQPIVSVTVEFMHLSGTDTQDVSGSQTDFVSVTEFGVPGSDDQTLSVNITNLTFE